MTSSMQPMAGFPVTLHEWEQLLTSALLRAQDGNADPIQSFEITPERLAFFCGKGPEDAVGAENAFRSALAAYPHLDWCLQHGRLQSASSETPGCIAILALSLLVDSLLDGDYNGTNQYRAKLRQWLGINRSFTVLRGLATMWKQLVSWLDTRVAEGAPYRQLILPEIPASWTHIGYTRYLSFPTRRDLRFLTAQIRRDPRLALDPASLVRLLDPVTGSSAVSFGLKKAFSEFRTALRSGEASADHRFWQLVEQARAAAGIRNLPLSELRMEFDEDGRRQYRISSGPSAIFLPCDIGTATSASALIDSPNLGPGARRGILFFHPVGLASWKATAQPPLNVGEYHVAVAPRHALLARGAIAEWEVSGSWLVTKSAVSVGTANDILKRLGIGTAQENLRTIGLVDGVHVGSYWLGLPRLLPRLEGNASTINVNSVGEGAADKLRLEDGRLVADGIVVGHYVFSDNDGVWSRRAKFVACAEVHGSLSGAAYSLPMHAEWGSNGSEQGLISASIEVVWDERPYEYQDIVEGLYASSRSGINEGEAVALINRVTGRPSWDFLRMLVESTFFDERLRQQWRGRSFTLGQARLEQLNFGTSNGVIVSGAIPTRLEDDFRKTVLMHGGRPFRRPSTGLALPVIGAVDVDARVLAGALGWSTFDVPALPSGRLEQNLIQTGMIGESYQVASHWDWMMRRFRVGGEASGPVTLTRLVHPGGRDHDLYLVMGKRNRTFTSRQSAILEAHAQAGVPMFEYIDSQIRRVTFEGALPIEIARALRNRVLLNGGICAHGWIYQVGVGNEVWLAKLLPGLISGVTVISGEETDDATRRGRGARRAMWINGSIAA